MYERCASVTVRVFGHLVTLWITELRSADRICRVLRFVGFEPSILFHSQGR